MSLRYPVSLHDKLLICMSLASHMKESCLTYGVATIRRLLKTIGLFCKRAL